VGNATVTRRMASGESEDWGRSQPPVMLARLYDAIAYDADPFVRDWVLERFDVVSEPDQPLAIPLQRGDILLRRAEGDFAHACLIVDPLLRSPGSITREGGFVEHPAAGRFAFVAERGLRPHDEDDRFARQVTDPAGRLLRRQLILRPRLAAAPAESEGLNTTSLLLGMTLAGSAAAPKPAASGEAVVTTRIEIPGEDDTAHPAPAVPRAQAVDQAEAMIGRFRASTYAGKWHPNLRRGLMADRLTELIRNPDVLDQAAGGLCGEAAFFNVWLWEDPLAVTRFALQLYNGGAAAVGTDEWVRPRPSLLAQDFGKVLAAARAHDWRLAQRSPNWGCEWMLMAALRDANNWVFAYDSTNPDGWGAGSSNGEVVDWLKATRRFRSVSFDKEDPLNMNPGNDVILVACDSHMLGNPKKGDKPDDDHFFLLRSDIKRSAQLCCHGQTAKCNTDVVDFRYWSWGESYQFVSERLCDTTWNNPVPGPLPRSQFIKEYFGHITARR
jgi:hypothetical protein